MSQCDKHVVESKYSDELIPSENLAQFVMKNWSKYGQKLAVVNMKHLLVVCRSKYE